ncbi:MAG TPA: hypothetical protein VMF06_06200 [Candidatus Limnocylindria bacterium]|jgi:hypothetical protein|nr:hypothetical protein [Candidatus Limnocylindria bacterium]
MLSLPIVARELQVASRRSSTYWFRAGGAVAGILIASLVMLGNFSSNSSQAFPIGQFLFWGIGGVALLVASLAGVTQTAETISTERREGTLGLLFLTDLTGLDVACGKFASSSLRGIYALIAIQPILSMSLLFGGVTFEEYLKASLVMLVTLGSSLSVGLLCSTMSPRERMPSVLAFISAIAMAGLGPAVAMAIGFGSQQLHRFNGGSARYAQFFLNCSNITAFISSSSQGSWTVASNYWTAITYITIVGILALAVAAWRLPRIWQDKPRHFSGRRNLLPAGARRLGLLDQDPIEWLALRYMGRGVIPWTLVVVQVAAALMVLQPLIMRPGTANTFDPFAIFLRGLSQLAKCILIIWVAVEAGRQLLADRRSGGLELQLGTALTDHSIVHGHWKALWRAFRWPLGISLVVEQIPSVVMFSSFGRQESSIFPIVTVLVQIIGSLAGWIALCIVSLEGAVILSSGRIALRALGLVYLLPWIIGVFGTAILGLVLAASNVASGTGSWYMLIATVFPTLIFVGNAYFWIRQARRNLYGKIRPCACAHAVPKGLIAPPMARAHPAMPPSTPPPLPGQP